MTGHLSPAAEWTLFVVLSAGALLGAYRMLRTMSMVRSGIFLMGSFCAVAGLFLVLSADLMASMQIMMYVGGMLVMIMFMVMMSPDPGGSMMGIAPPEHEGEAKEFFCPMHPDVRSKESGKCSKCGMALQPIEMKASDAHPSSMQRGSGNDHKRQPQSDQKEVQGGMGTDMAMTHEFTRPAAVLGALVVAVLLAVIFSVHWPAAAEMRSANSAMIVGKELLSRYMIAFEGAGLLILLGIAGAVVFGRKEE